MIESPILFSAPMVRAIRSGTKTQTRRVLKVQPPANTVQFCTYHHPDPRAHHWAMDGGSLLDFAVPCPYGQPGDRLWVREKFQPLLADGVEHWRANWETGEGYAVSYPATDGIVEWIDADDNISSACKPSIHMPRWASRITLEVTDVRVERLQAISEADALCEGISSVRCQAWDQEHFPEWRHAFDEAVEAGHKPPLGPTPSQAFSALWDSINASNRPKLPVNVDSKRYARVKAWLEAHPDTSGWAANPWVWVVSFKQVEVA